MRKNKLIIIIVSLAILLAVGISICSVIGGKGSLPKTFDARQVTEFEITDIIYGSEMADIIYADKNCCVFKDWERVYKYNFADKKLMQSKNLYTGIAEFALEKGFTLGEPSWNGTEIFCDKRGTVFCSVYAKKSTESQLNIYGVYEMDDDWESISKKAQAESFEELYKSYDIENADVRETDLYSEDGIALLSDKSKQQSDWISLHAAYINDTDYVYLRLSGGYTAESLEIVRYTADKGFEVYSAYKAS